MGIKGLARQNIDCVGVDKVKIFERKSDSLSNMKLPEKLLKFVEQLKTLKSKIGPIKDLKKNLLSILLSPFAYFRPSLSREPVLSVALLLLILTVLGVVGGVNIFMSKQHEKAMTEHGEKSLLKRGNGFEEYEVIDEEALLAEGHLTEEAVVEGSHEHGEHTANKDAGHEEDGHGEGGHEGGHGEASDGTIKLGENPIPDEVMNRKNGIPAAGYDLNEPQKSIFSRTLASDSGKALEVKVGNYYVLFDTIYGNARVGNDSEGALILSLNLEVDNFLARGEVDSRKQEFTGLINTVLYQFQKDFLLTHEGKMELKKKIQDELNHKMKTGRIVDVLFSEIQMRP